MALGESSAVLKFIAIVSPHPSTAEATVDPIGSDCTSATTAASMPSLMSRVFPSKIAISPRSLNFLGVGPTLPWVAPDSDVRCAILAAGTAVSFDSEGKVMSISRFGRMVVTRRRAHAGKETEQPGLRRRRPADHGGRGRSRTHRASLRLPVRLQGPLGADHRRPQVPCAAKGVDVLVSEAIAVSMTRSLGEGACSGGRDRAAAIMHDIEDYTSHRSRPRRSPTRRRSSCSSSITCCPRRRLPRPAGVRAGDHRRWQGRLDDSRRRKPLHAADRVGPDPERPHHELNEALHRFD